MIVSFGNSNSGNIILGVENNIKGPETFTDCPDFKVWKIVKGFRKGTSQPVHDHIE